MNSGKTQSYYNNRSNIKRDIPLPKDNLKNKSNTISILPGEKKIMGRTYIYSSTRYNQRPQSNEVKTEKRTYSNNGIVFINENKKNNKSENKNNINNNSSNNSSKKIIISSSLRDKVEDNKVNSQTKEIKHNTFYYNSSRTTRKENKPFIDNNQIYISEPSTSNKNNNKVKTNLTRIVITSADNSPNLNRNNEKNQKKDIEPKNMNKIIINSEETKPLVDNNLNQNENMVSEKTKITDNNEVITEKEIITTTKTEMIVDENEKDKDEILPQISSNFNNDNIVNDVNADITEDKIFEIYNIPGNDLSDDTKNYLNSYMSSARPELSDFSKQFLSSTVTTNSNTRPELSNITRAYLFSQTPIEDDSDENK